MSSPTRPGVWLPEKMTVDEDGVAHNWEPTSATSWCDVCWPGNRCTVCGRPSGDLGQCGPCLHAANDLDKAIEARTQ